MQLKFFSLACLLLLSFATTAAGQSRSDQWQLLQSTDGSKLSARHEAAGVVLGESIYLIGGRGNRPVERYIITTGQWENLGLAPLELHHAQPVVIGDDIYIAGAFTCCYPRERIVAEIHVLDTRTNTWDVVGSMPAERLRGSTAAVSHEGKLYLLGGNTQGHDGGAVAWFDEYDPTTGKWQILPDAPHARDHFSAVLIGNELVAASGRQTALPNPAANPVQAVDIYDFESGQWRSGAPIPTVRGGAASVAYAGDVIVAGGEINTSGSALSVVEAYDVVTDAWRTLPAMITGRHGSGGGVSGRRMFMLSGASSIGGATETEDAETLLLSERVVVPTDTGGSTTGGTEWGGSETGGAETGASETSGTGSDGTGTADGGAEDGGNVSAGATSTGSTRSGAFCVFLMLPLVLCVVLRRREQQGPCVA